MTDPSPNIAVAVLDTVRKDAFDRHFDWLDGVSYDNAWSTTHYSPAAHGSLFTGRHGSEIGVHSKSPDLDCSDPTLAELLREAGYTTRGFSANTYVSKYFDFDRGFETFTNETRVVSGDESSFNWPKFIKSHKNDGPRRYVDLVSEIVASDAPLLPTLKQGAKIKLEDLGVLLDDGTYEDGQKALDYVQSTDFDAGDEFLFMNLMDAHGPYKAPAEYRTADPVDVSAAEQMLADDPKPVSSDDARAAYDDCVRYLADIYRRLHTRLTEDFDCVITLADHGEAFGEYDHWGHSGLGPAATHIPLSVYTGDGAETPVPTEQPVNLHDVFRTVCDITGVHPPKGTRGTSLTSDEVRDSRYKLLETHGMSTELMNGLLEKGYDRETLEQRDKRLHAAASERGYAFETFDDTMEYVGERIPDAKSKIETLKQQLDRREDAEEVEISDEVHRRLEELGYA